MLGIFLLAFCRHSLKLRGDARSCYLLGRLSPIALCIHWYMYLRCRIILDTGVGHAGRVTCLFWDYIKWLKSCEYLP